MRGLLIAGGVLAGFAAFQLFANRQAATVAQDSASLDVGPAEESAWNSVDLWGMSSAAIEGYQLQKAMSNDDTAATNLSAFLSMIATSEGTDRGADPYRVCYGYRHTIVDLSDHPAVTGEWRGESIANLGPAYAGKVSTAAGRYQMIRATWLDCKRAAGLSDFGAASQDKAAVYLIKRRGALEDVQAGRVADAISKCRLEWASLPGAGYGQPERKLAELQAAYEAAGGNLA